MNWYPVQCCVSCKQELIREERHFHDGVCPYCGHRDNIGVVAETFTRVAKDVLVYCPEWWEFWKSKKYKRVYLEDKK